MLQELVQIVTNDFPLVVQAQNRWLLFAPNPVVGSHRIHAISLTLTQTLNLIGMMTKKLTLV